LVIVFILIFTTVGIGIMKPIVLSISQWQAIRAELQTEHPRTVFMLRDKMKRVLGFTVREHNEWIIKPDGGYGEHSIHLDFYSERKYTMFILKFSEYLQ
jgi:hypothetical protein